MEGSPISFWWPASGLLPKSTRSTTRLLYLYVEVKLALDFVHITILYERSREIFSQRTRFQGPKISRHNRTLRIRHYWSYPEYASWWDFTSREKQDHRRFHASPKIDF